MNHAGAKESPYISLLKKELVTAMGCTEPSAAALAAASARVALGTEPAHIVIRASRDIIKNAMHVGIPNSEMKGIKAAVAMGIACGDASKGLNILSGLEPETELHARRLLESNAMELELAENVPPLFIEIRLTTGKRRAGARIVHDHTNLERIGADEWDRDFTCEMDDLKSTMPKLDLPGIVAFASAVPAEEIDFLVDGALINMELAEHSLKAGYGICVGKITFESYGAVQGNERPTIDYLFRKGASLAAAGSDARMAGCPMPVVINSGSGNQGITISVPILILAQGLHCSREETARALCLAHLVALMMTFYKDRLSALCGAFTASIGTAAGYIRLLGGSYVETNRCIDIMVANLTGLLCDGAKGSCALKIYSCLDGAALAVKLAMAGSSVSSGDGIVGYSQEETMLALEKISHEGMIPLDKTVLSVMLNKGVKQATE
ncbi:MAG: L-serine ammonia-lyase, iron-sulfur-dependent, subunit alpha [Christensenella sp.]